MRLPRTDGGAECTDSIRCRSHGKAEVQQPQLNFIGKWNGYDRNKRIFWKEGESLTSGQLTFIFFFTFLFTFLGKSPKQLQMPEKKKKMHFLTLCKPAELWVFVVIWFV